MFVIQITFSTFKAFAESLEILHFRANVENNPVGVERAVAGLATKAIADKQPASSGPSKSVSCAYFAIAACGNLITEYIHVLYVWCTLVRMMSIQLSLDYPDERFATFNDIHRKRLPAHAH